MFFILNETLLDLAQHLVLGLELLLPSPTVLPLHLLVHLVERLLVL